ncbi:hypothetical protein ARMSODRAFT_1025176 [Armillaria solidipes]|uniref:Uncharacterized protein n=1 Tax=Armillaria solidipes TaxID=1076256 RepID=A0A2H3ATH1_9AGAR|nr:hypothetical protein ARMSODRAFT_1025176 [Armillaria solidipes]
MSHHHLRHFPPPPPSPTSLGAHPAKRTLSISRAFAIAAPTYSNANSMFDPPHLTIFLAPSCPLVDVSITISTPIYAACPNVEGLKIEGDGGKEC